jgi:type I restriction enzyme S subunit
MDGEWGQSSIGELCDTGIAELQTGPFGSQLHAHDYVDEGVPVVPTEAIRGRQIDHSVLPRISQATAKKLARHRLRIGDILFARRGAQATGHIGCVRKAEDGFICGTGAIRLRVTRPSNEIDSDYLSHVLANPASVAWFKFHAIGATMPNLNESIIRSFPLSIPPLPEQRAIAHILGTLDDKIELNRRMNETLEAMARALFKSWFVDFDPVRAKAEGRDTGLPKHIADLFPDSFEDSELGEVPKGWDMKPLADCVDVARGLSYKGSGLSDTGMPMHNLNSIYEGGGYKHDGLKHYIGDYKSQHIASAGDLIVANTEQGHDRLLIGYAAIVPSRFGSESLFSHHIYRIRPKIASALTVDYLRHLLNTGVMHDIVSGYANGTTVNMLPIDGLQSPLIVIPPARIVVAFSEIAAASRVRHEEMIEESRTLGAVRDALLPKLISGELRISNAR